MSEAQSVQESGPERVVRAFWGWSVALGCVLVACGGSAARSSGDGGSGGGSRRAISGDTGDDAGTSSAAAACDLSGSWIAQRNTRNTALGVPQLSTNWSYLQIEQHGTHFTVVAGFDCGYVVRGTTDVSLSDTTLEATAQKASDAAGTKGTFMPTADGKACELGFERIYAIRGANKAKFLDAVWKVGDAPKELPAFPMPTNAVEGMEDWDGDGHEGLTQLTGFGDRYTAQIDWYALHGQVPQHALQFGGDGVLTADYDEHEALSKQTPAILQTSSTPMPPGYGFMLRADAARVTKGAHPELETCKNVQARAIEKFGDPPAP